MRFPQIRRPLAVALMVFLISASVSAALIWRLAQNELKMDRARLAGLALDHARALETNIERALSATYTLATLVRQGNGSIANFDAVAIQMLQFYPGVSAFELAPGGIIRNIAPLAGNEKALGFDQLRDPEEGKEAFIARDTGRLTLSGPKFLVQGGMGAIGHLPVYLEDKNRKSHFWGFTNVLIRFPEALVGARLPQLEEQGIDYELWRIHPDSGKRQGIASSSANILIAPVEQNLDLAYGNWTLSVAPVKGWGDPLGLWMKALLGLFCSLLLGYVAMLVMKLQIHKEQLESKVAERTQALALANEDLAGRESFLRQILDTSSMAIFLVDMRGRITQANRRMAEMFGRPLAEFEGTEYVSLVHPAEREIGRQKMLALLSSAIPSVDYDRLYWRADHTEFWGHLTGRRFYGPRGVELGLIGAIVDITPRKQTEAALIRNERLLRLSQTAARMGNYVIDLASGEWESSPLLDEIWGIDARFKRDISGWLSLIHPDHRQRIAGEFEKTLERRAAFSREYMIIRPSDGETRWVLTWGDYEYDGAGKPVRQVGSVQDITERKRAESELRVAAATFEAQQGISITDAAKVILRVNRAFTEITGYSAEETVGQTPRLLSSGRHDAAFYRAMWESIARTGSWQGEIWNRRKSGEVYPEWLTITAVKGDDGSITHYVGTFADITLRKAAEDEIKDLAFFDPLTRLPNRRLLLNRLQQALATSARSGREGALLFIDLDNFKTINDTLGHDKGDLLLQQVGQRLVTCVREGDTVARLGGDEFVVMLEDLSDNRKEAATQSEAVGEKILATLNQTYLLAGHRHHSTPSIGVTLFVAHQNSVEELLKRADLAMYQAKAAGRNTLRFFDPDMQAVVSARASMEADLGHGIQDEQFLLHYQAQMADDGRLTGVEALVRWRHPLRGLVSPAEFIPLAEETGLIFPLGHWVLQTACRQLALWATRAEMAHLTVAVNVSARQFNLPNFVEEVLALLDHHQINPQRLKLELTESLLVADVEGVIAKMTALKARGVGFSLDDFGTGFSSLSYLKRLPLDQLKIDQGFVRDILTDPNDAAIAKMVVALADSMGLSVMAEGVETAAQRDFLARHGCHAYQGYLFSRPLPLEEFETFAQRL